MTAPTWAMFPINGKTPLGPWREQSTTDPAARWRWTGHTGLGIDCGKSGLLVVDEDRLDGFAAFAASIGETIPDTYIVRTGKGRHFYFAQPATPLGNSPGALKPFGCDVRGDGGYVVAAGSRHASGALYTAENDLAPAAMSGLACCRAHSGVGR
jgi:hypothetical protein